MFTVSVLISNLLISRLSQFHKKLRYRRGTIRRAMLASTCYICFTWEGSSKGFKMQSDLQGHSRTLPIVPFDMPHTTSY